MFRRLVQPTLARSYASSAKKSWANQSASRVLGRVMVEVAEAEPRRSEIDSEFLPNLTADGTNVYEPFDFSLAQKRVVRKNRLQQPKRDRLEATGINPLELWKSPDVLSHFVTSNGKIIPGYLSGTKGKNHKKLAKAIRRARAAGLLSPLHRSVFSQLQP